MSRLRFSEYVPSPPEQDARVLRGLPSSWEQPVPESAIDALLRRARAVASGLSKAGRLREAAELRWRIALLERADELHRHASDVETLAQLYRALTTFSDSKDEGEAEGSRTWLQAGVVEGAPPFAHGPAFRETAVLRQRAFRWVQAALSRSER